MAELTAEKAREMRAEHRDGTVDSVGRDVIALYDALVEARAKLASVSWDVLEQTMRVREKAARRETWAEAARLLRKKMDGFGMVIPIGSVAAIADDFERQAPGDDNG